MGEFSIAANTSELGHNGDLSDLITSRGARLTGGKCKGGSHLRDVEPCTPGPQYKEERTYCQGLLRSADCPLTFSPYFSDPFPYFPNLPLVPLPQDCPIVLSWSLLSPFIHSQPR